MLSSGSYSLSSSQDDGSMPTPTTTGTAAATEVPAQWKESTGSSKAITLSGDEPGNWYRKRHILQEARKLYETLTKQIVALSPERERFEKIRTEDLDKKFDSFYQDCGFQQGEIDGQLSAIADEIKQAQAEAGISVTDQRELLKQLEEKRTELGKLKEEYMHVQKLDAAANEAIKTLNSEIDKAQTYETSAWEQYQKIADTLNDEVAEDLYRRIEASLRNVQALERYIKNDMTQFFSTLSSDVDKQIEVVKSKIEALRAKGVELNKKVLEEKAAAAREQERLKKLKEQQLAAQKAKEAAQKTWTYKVNSFFQSIWGSLRGWTISSYQAVRGLFVTKK